MAWSMLVYEQIKAFLLDQLDEDGGFKRAQREVKKRYRAVKKRYNIVAKALLLFDGFVSLLRTDHKYLTPQHITKARECATNAVCSMANNGTVGDPKVPCI